MHENLAQKNNLQYLKDHACVFLDIYLNIFSAHTYTSPFQLTNPCKAIYNLNPKI